MVNDLNAILNCVQNVSYFSNEVLKMIKAESFEMDVYTQVCKNVVGSNDHLKNKVYIKISI
jgi:hypothetical protein